MTILSVLQTTATSLGLVVLVSEIAALKATLDAANTLLAKNYLPTDDYDALIAQYGSADAAPSRQKSSKPEAERIYNLDLFDRIKVGSHTWVQRVPGGWIVYSHINQTDRSEFIPYNEEYMWEESS